MSGDYPVFLLNATLMMNPLLETLSLYIYYIMRWCTTMTMIKLRSDLHSRTTPHTSPLQGIGIIVYIYISRAHRILLGAIYDVTAAEVWSGFSYGISTTNNSGIRIHVTMDVNNRTVPINGNINVATTSKYSTPRGLCTRVWFICVCRGHVPTCFTRITPDYVTGNEVMTWLSLYQ